LTEAKLESQHIHNCQFWASLQFDREVPNLLSPVIHRDRLGEVIDEDLGLTGTANAVERIEREAGKAQEIKRYSVHS
jgi:hypothetical protein